MGLIAKSPVGKHLRMKYKIIILLTLFSLNSCKDSTQEKKGTVIDKQFDLKNETVEKKTELIQTTDTKIENKLSDCDKYWINRFPKDSLKLDYINGIISKNKLSENNLNFLNALKREEKENLGFESVLSPIFRLSNTDGNRLFIFVFERQY